MRFSVLGLCLLLSVSPAYAQLVTTEASGAAPPERWMDAICRQYSAADCLMAEGWHWLRKNQFIIDPALKTLAASSATYTVAVVARFVVGETPGVVFLLTVSRAGMQAGTTLLIAGAVSVVIGIFVGAVGFFFGSTTSTQSAADDAQPAPECVAALKPFQGDGGLERLLALAPEGLEKLIPCLNQDRNLAKFLTEVGKNGPVAETALARP